MLARMLVYIVVAMPVTAWLASPAMAHFVWIETETTAAGVLVRSGFGEPEGWDPDMINRIQAARFWQQGADGLKPLELKLDAKEREYRGLVAGARPVSVIASCDFGVIQFGGNPPSWLRYTAKSLVGPPAAWPQQRAIADLRIELLATVEADGVRLTALHLGKPLVGAKIKCSSPKLERLELVTDEQGAAHWPLAGSGLYACYVGTTVATPGKLGEKSYEVLKDYTTLTFTVGETSLPKP